MGLISLIVGGIMDANKARKQHAAKNNDNFQTVNVKNLYTIDVPEFLSPAKDTTGDSSLFYRSKTLDIALNVIDESKAEFIQAWNDIIAENPSLYDPKNTVLDNMANVTLNQMFDVDKMEMLEYTSTTINGLNALLVKVFQKRTFLKDALYASFAFVEGRDMLYQVILQSGGTSINKLSDKLDQSIYSFCEIGGSQTSAYAPEQQYVPASPYAPSQSSQPTPAGKYCHHCGAKLQEESDLYCSACGTRQNI